MKIKKKIQKLPAQKDLAPSRNLIRHWGFKYVEEIIWIKPQKDRIYNTENNTRPYGQLFNSRKEYCLVGVSGNVKRNNDYDFIHSNCDIDLIIQPENGEYECDQNQQEPQEIFEIIERFCLGRRRVQIFGDESSRRDGWVTIGENVRSSDFERREYESYFRNGHLVNVDNDVEILRPKSPSMKEN